MSPSSKQGSPELLSQGEWPQKGRTRLVVLSRRSDFLRTFRLGRKLRPADWVVFNVYRKTAEDEPQGFRCGWTCPKSVGNAVIRNRLKRWSRQWCRSKLKSLATAGAEPPNVDLNLGFRSMPEGFYRRLKYSEFCLAMDRAWEDILRWKR